MMPRGMSQVLFLFGQSLRVFSVLTVIVGLGYPLLVTFAGHAFFPWESNGSLIVIDGKTLASQWIAQKTRSPRLFWPRPSASDFGAVPSGASNQGPTSQSLRAAIDERKASGFDGEMLFASGSGLDPHISMAAAIGQLPRIVESRNFGDIEKQEVLSLLQGSLERRDLGFLGEERVNVVKLNLKLIEKFGK